MIVLLNSMYRGGIGKTTNSILLTHELAERGYKVLFIDVDPQVSGTRILTQRSIYDEFFQEKNIYHAMHNDDLGSNILSLQENIDYVPGSEYVNLFESLMREKGITNLKYQYFRSLLKMLSEKKTYDFVIMDMSPSKSALNTAVIATATHHIINAQSEIISAEMIYSYLSDIKEIQAAGVESTILGISIGMKERTRLSIGLVREIKKQFGDTVFNTVIKRQSKIHEYIANGYPTKNRFGRLYAVDKRALCSHHELTNEILHRIGLPNKKESVDSNDK